MFSVSDSSSGDSSRRGWLKRLSALLAGGALLSKGTVASARSGQSVASPQGTQAFVGEIMMISCGFAPRGWALCNGQLLSINQNQALFSLLGTQYGGNGQTTFALPDLRGRIPIHMGSGYTMGQLAGSETATLTALQVPSHLHGVKCSTGLGTTTLSGASGPVTHNYLADNGGGAPQYGNVANAQMAVQDASNNVVNISGNTGGSQPHTNMQPYQCINFVIALQGVFPSQI